MPELADKVKDLDAAIEAKRGVAQEAWAAFDKLRTDLAEEGVDVTDQESDAFKQAHQAHEAYGTAADEVDVLRQRRDELAAMLGEKDNPDGPGKDARTAVKDLLASRETPGARIIAGELWKQAKAAGVFTSSGNLGRVQLGEMMSRDEFIGAISPQASVIVTDESADQTVRPFIEPQHRGFVEPRWRPLLLLDLITVMGTDSDSVDYVVETGWTNNAGWVAEAQSDAAIGVGSGEVTPAVGGRKPQSALTYEKRDTAVKILAHWAAATKKALADAARLRGLIDNRLRRGLGDVLEDSIIAGDGTEENLLGILNQEGIQHQERGAGPLVEDVLRALTKVRLAFFEPSAVGLNPLDFQEIRLQRNDSGAGPGTGDYLYGPPSQVGPTTLWGTPSVQGPQFPVDQPIVGDWSVVELFIREGVQVLASDSHADFFVRNLVAVLAEMRAALAVPQPEGLCEISEGS